MEADKQDLKSPLMSKELEGGDGDASKSVPSMEEQSQSLAWTVFIRVLNYFKVILFIVVFMSFWFK